MTAPRHFPSSLARTCDQIIAYLRDSRIPVGWQSTTEESTGPPGMARLDRSRRWKGSAWLGSRQYSVGHHTGCGQRNGRIIQASTGPSARDR